MRKYIGQLGSLYLWIADFLFVLFIVVGIPLGVIDYGDNHKPMCSVTRSGDVVSFTEVTGGIPADCSNPESFEPEPLKPMDLLRFLGVALVIPILLPIPMAVFLALDD